MSLSADNCKIVYVSVGLLLNEPICLLAKIEGGGAFRIWIKPENIEQVTAHCADRGIIFTDSAMIRGNSSLPTVPLARALIFFRNFLAKIPKPAVLISHSGDLDTKCLIRAIARTGTTNIFRGVVAGFSDSLVEFTVRFPNRKEPRQLTIPALAHDFLGEQENLISSSHRLFFLERLVATCNIPTSAFFDHVLPYELAFDLYEEMNEWVLPQYSYI